MSRQRTYTYTVADLELSAAAYDEIAAKLKAAEYHHCFMDGGGIDMHGIAVTRREQAPPPRPLPSEPFPCGYRPLFTWHAAWSRIKRLVGAAEMRKGGHNAWPSRVTKRPPPPPAVKPLELDREDFFR